MSDALRKKLRAMMPAEKEKEGDSLLSMRPFDRKPILLTARAFVRALNEIPEDEDEFLGALWVFGEITFKNLQDNIKILEEMRQLEINTRIVPMVMSPEGAPMNRERYDYQEPKPEEYPRSQFRPHQSRHGCICSPLFRHNGVRQPYSPSCPVSGHGCTSRRLPPTARLWPDQREVGIVHSRGTNRR